MTKSNVDKNVVVRIYDEDYPITGGGDPAHISKIADFVDSRMKEIAESSKVKSRDKVAILAALSIASELYEKSEDLGEATGGLASQVDNILMRLDLALQE